MPTKTDTETMTRVQSTPIGSASSAVDGGGRGADALRPAIEQRNSAPLPLARCGVRPRHYAQDRGAHVLDETIRALRDGGDSTATNAAIGTRLGIHEKHVRDFRAGDRPFHIGDVLLLRLPHALALLEALKAELLDASTDSPILIAPLKCHHCGEARLKQMYGAAVALNTVASAAEKAAV